MDDSSLSPAALAEAKRSRFQEIGDREYQLWRHNPITASFLQFMEDQVAHWRELAADLVIAGAFQRGDAHEDRNPDVVRGKIIAFRDLHQISLESIQEFYSQADADESTAIGAEQSEQE